MHESERKADKKIDQSEATNNVDPSSNETHVDALPTKYLKLKSSIVAEHAASLNRHDDDDAMVDDVSNSNDSYDEHNLTGLNQSNNVSLKGRTNDALIKNDVLNLAPDNADELGLQPVTTSDVYQSGLTLKKPETPSHSLVNGDSVLKSKTKINALNSAPDANELGLTQKKPKTPGGSLKPETTRGSLVNCDSVMKSKTEINGLDSTQDADELGLNSTLDADELGLTLKKPETPSGSLVNYDLVLESKAEISGLNPTPDANELDLTLKKPETSSGSLVNCDSVLESKATINGLNLEPDANMLDLTSKQPDFSRPNN
nr:hypothetical protein [Tanacetum cinerariifolium]